MKYDEVKKKLKALSVEERISKIKSEAKEYSIEYEKHQVEKCKKLIAIGRIMSSIEVKDRKFDFVDEYNDIITNNDVDYAIAASKITDIDDYIHLGWNRIRRIAECTSNHKYLSIKSIEEEFGDLKDNENLETFLIYSILKKSKVKGREKLNVITIKHIRDRVKMGLRTTHVTKYAIAKIIKSGNVINTFKHIQWRIYPDDLSDIDTNKDISKKDIERINNSMLYFINLLKDSDRISSLPEELLINLKELVNTMLDKYMAIHNDKKSEQEIAKLNSELNKLSEAV